MTMQRPNATPRVPTPPAGDEIARYATYLEAQKAVDFLSDRHFAVQNVTIVGEGLRAVERVTGRLTYARVAIAGLASGAWFGLFVGLLLTLFGASKAGGTLIAAIGIGAAFGALFGIISYALTGNQRDFTSQSQIVASSYAIWCANEVAGEARKLLSELGLAQVAAPSVAPTPPAPGQPPAAGGGSWAMPPAGAQAPGTAPDGTQKKPVAPPAHFTTASGLPRYGRRLEDADKPPEPEAPPEPARSASAEPEEATKVPTPEGTDGPGGPPEAE